jgi:hypothetical protein
MSTRAYIHAASFALLALAVAAPASAMPHLIRLGYPTCRSCHLTPQGGGLLTPYGKGIDLARALWPREGTEPEPGGDALGSRLNYDGKVLFAIDRDPPADAKYGFNVYLRSAIGIMPSHRLVYSAAVRSPALTRSGTTGEVTATMPRLYWLYEPREGLSFTVGRDELPTGLGLPGPTAFSSPVNNPGVSANPTQAKVFWWNDRWQVSAYGFGPDGNERDRAFEARGGGAVVGATINDRLVIGGSTRVSRADAFDRTNAGVFMRLGINERWGILAEHDVTTRTSGSSDLRHFAGYTQVYYAPVEWFQTGLALEHLTTSGGPGADTYRLSPSAEMRFTPNMKAVFSVRDVHTTVDSRTYLFEVHLKTQ